MTLVPGTGTGQKLSPTQIYQLAVQAGFSATDAVTATAIAIAESGGQTNIRSDIAVDAHGPTFAAGLWQIFNGYSAQTLAFQQSMADPLANAQAAYAKFKSGGWCQWASYDEGPCAGQANRNNSWRQYLGMAQAAATGADIAGGGGSLVVPSQSGTDTSAATVVASGGASTTSSNSSAPLTLGSILGQPVEVHTGLLWSFLFIGGAIALVSVGIYLVFRQQINAAAGTAAEVAAVAA